MSRAKLNEEILDAFRSEYFGEDEQPDKNAPRKLRLEWRPRMNPVQQRMYDCKTDVIVSAGPRGSGKTTCGLHKLVEHCVFNQNALGFIVVKEGGQAIDGGAWDKLTREILDIWKNGNIDWKTRKRLDGGMGIEFTPPKYDPMTKKPYVYVSNIHGGWSKITLHSFYVGPHVEDKIKGREPSFILFDEAQTFETDDYYVKVSQQVGRRQGIDGPTQLVYCVNPKGPSHWIYQHFYMHQVMPDSDEKIVFPIDDITGHPINPVTHEPVKFVSIFNVPTIENLHNLPSGYWERVQNAVKNDPIEEARMVRGEWVEKPEGDAMFAEEWDASVHVVGDTKKNEGLLPMTNHPVIVTWDPGGAHTSLHFEQVIPMPDKIIWTVFDEINFVGRYMPYAKLVPKLIQRMQYWEEKMDGKQFEYRHISDDSAFNQFRAKDGSFDAADIERFSKEYVERLKLPERFVIKMEACPKGPHSVAARVRVVKDLLIGRNLFISATCPKTIDMFNKLEEDKNDRMHPKRSAQIHSFDSLSFGPFFFNSGRGQNQIVTKPIPAREFFVVGRG